MAELGFKDTFREKVFEPLLKLRGFDGGPGKDASLEKFMQDYLKLTNDKGKPMTKRDLYLEMGAMPWEMTLSNLVHRKDDFRYLAGEEIRDMVVEGLQADPVTAWYHHLCTTVGEPVGAMTVITPQIKYKDAGPAAVGQGETLPQATIMTSERGVRLTKKGRMIEITDEAAKSAPINLLKPYLAEVAATIVSQENDHVVDVLVNGDQRSGGDEAAVVGVLDTTKNFQYDDFDQTWIFGAAINQGWFTMVTNRATASLIRKISEFRNNQGYGSPRVELKAVNDIEPGSMLHIISRRMPNKKALLVNNKRSTRQLVFMPVVPEEARYPERMVSGVTIATITGYENINRKARIIMDCEKAFETYGFPADWEQAAA